MINGIARNISIEMNHLRLFLFDLNQDIEQSNFEICELLLHFEKKIADIKTTGYTEYKQKKNVVFINRLQADLSLNQNSKEETKHQMSKKLTCLKKLKRISLKLNIENSRNLDSVFFRKNHGLSQFFIDDYVEIKIEAVDVNDRVKAHYHKNKNTEDSQISRTLLFWTKNFIKTSLVQSVRKSSSKLTKLSETWQ